MVHSTKAAQSCPHYLRLCSILITTSGFSILIRTQLYKKTLRNTNADNKYIKKFWSENLKGRDHLEDLGGDERIILKWTLRKLGGRVWT
jgi:hypothetical protein